MTNLTVYPKKSQIHIERVMRVRITRNDLVEMTENLRPSTDPEAQEIIEALTLWARLSKNPYAPFPTASPEQVLNYFQNTLRQKLLNAIDKYESEKKSEDALTKTVAGRIRNAASYSLALPRSIEEEPRAISKARKLLSLKMEATDLTGALLP